MEFVFDLCLCVLELCFLFLFLALRALFFFLFFFNDTATTEIYTLSLHDALPICHRCLRARRVRGRPCQRRQECADRKSTRLNSSHLVISYAVFCLKKKKPLVNASVVLTTNPTHFSYTTSIALLLSDPHRTYNICS